MVFYVYFETPLSVDYILLSRVSQNKHRKPYCLLLIQYFLIVNYAVISQSYSVPPCNTCPLTVNHDALNTCWGKTSLEHQKIWIGQYIQIQRRGSCFPSLEPPLEVRCQIAGRQRRKLLDLMANNLSLEVRKHYLQSQCGTAKFIMILLKLTTMDFK